MSQSDQLIPSVNLNASSDAIFDRPESDLKVHSTSSKTTGRIFWCDWLRTLTIYCVSIEHCVNSMDGMYDYSKNSTLFAEWKDGFGR